MSGALHVLEDCLSVVPEAGRLHRRHLGWKELGWKETPGGILGRFMTVGHNLGASCKILMLGILIMGVPLILRDMFFGRPCKLRVLRISFLREASYGSP